MGQFHTRWTVLAAAILVESIGGIFYAFGLISPILKSTFKLEQSQLDQIASAANLGGNLGVHMGFLVDAAGPTVVLILAGLMGSSSWLLMWASIYFAWPMHNNWWGLVLISLIQGQAQLTSDTAVVPVIGQHFPHNRGAALGLTKAFVGLSGSIVQQMYNGFFEGHIVTFMFFLGIYVAAICGLGALFVHLPTAQPRSHASVAYKLNLGYASVFALLLLLLGSALAEHFLDVTAGVRVLLTLAMFTLLALVIGCLASFKESAAESHRLAAMAAAADVSDKLLAEEENLPVGPGHVPSDANHDPTTSSTVNREGPAATRTQGAQGTQGVQGTKTPGTQETVQQYTLLQTLRKVEFWLLFTSILLGTGSGMMLINNLGQVVLTLGMRHSDRAVFVSLISIFNCAGRLLAGNGSDRLLQWHCTPRPFVLGGAMLVMAVSMLLLAIGQPWVLYAAVPLCGLAEGWAFLWIR